MGFHVPLIIRGRIVEGDTLRFAMRRDGAAFETPDVRRHIHALPLADPADLADIHALSTEEIIAFLAALGRELRLDRNPHLQEAYALSVRSSGLTGGIVRHLYATLGDLFSAAFIRELADNAIGIDYLDGWVPRPMANGCVCNIRAFGARAVHVLAGNVPMPSALGIIRNAITRSDAIFKTPSNDPATAAAIARTMIAMDPDHPVTRHLSIAYWKGGDEAVEAELYRPDRIEKIIAWGGQASITHIARYIQPGIDLITMDPKLSSSIVGREAFADDRSMHDAAVRLALDIAYFNQQACANSRVTYVETGTDAAGLAAANRFGTLLFDAIQALPETCSAAAPLDTALAEEVQALRLASFDHKVIGGGAEGAVILSQIDEPVDFAPLLNNRVANLVPIDDLDIAVRSVTSYTQSIGIYPDALKERLRDRLVFNGAQRLVSLGYACKAAMAGPHDGMEPLRRMCKWISDESNDPSVVPLLSSPKATTDAQPRNEFA
ncbi:acyl-CoA reductase [Flavisphingomonas formosensis]|uniref:acyl-CoA reductase n=1 Tax=Flavisphingomonas formosensis TaxID=861534 RepID=UPI0012F96286|nr:acyl-CoA reductase [Sphingomonas formosensis]